MQHRLARDIRVPGKAAVAPSILLVSAKDAVRSSEYTERSVEPPTSQRATAQNEPHSELEVTPATEHPQTTVTEIQGSPLSAGTSKHKKHRRSDEDLDVDNDVR